MTPTLGSRLIWFAVVGGVGVTNTLLLCGGSSYLNAKFNLRAE